MPKSQKGAADHGGSPPSPNKRTGKPQPHDRQAARELKIRKMKIAARKTPKIGGQSRRRAPVTPS